jgi:hypothetical protein
VKGEIDTADVFERLRAGVLPVLPPQGVEVRAGEIVHYQNRALFRRVRQLKSGPRSDEYVGQLVITDYRLVFSSPERSFDVNHRSVVSIVPMDRGIELRAGGKGSGFYSMGRFGTVIYTVAVKKANQTIVQTSDSDVTRHIPRDVRQRVWQRYGGRCAECGADQYLEFDHIIPHAKGGSNSDSNVQLLCRGCNGKKSAMI